MMVVDALSLDAFLSARVRRSELLHVEAPAVQADRLEEFNSDVVEEASACAGSYVIQYPTHLLLST